MHLFVYEWVTGGGLLGHDGALPASLLTEGLAMAQAVAADAVDAGARVTLLGDLRVPQLAAGKGGVETVDSRTAHNDAFERLCREADGVLIIAPEIDGELSRVVSLAEQHGAKLLSPGLEFVAIASDKQVTAGRLTEAGIPIPQGVVVEPDAHLPDIFPYPAVIKPIDGAGSESIYMVTGPHDAPPAYVGPRRLEAFSPGVAASVAVLAGPQGVTPLPACRQRLSDDGRLRYSGGEAPLAAGLDRRASDLAVRAASALPNARGYIGVDIVLGASPDGSEDVVIEINPRLTTSYTALRFVVGPNLAQAMIDAVNGKPLDLTFDQRPLEFGVDGTVSYLDD